MAGGRPTVYKPEYCQQVIDHMKDGYSLESFGGVIMVSKDTLQEWKNKYPDFSASIKIGEACSLHAHEAMGMAIATGQSKVSGGAAAVWIFGMKNKHKWTDKLEVQGAEDKPLILKYALDTAPRDSNDESNGDGSSPVEGDPNG